MLFADLAQLSAELADTGSRRAKVTALAGLLTRATKQPATSPPDELWLVVRYLSGSLRQRRTGVAMTWFRSRSEEPDGPTVTVRAVDACLQACAAEAGTGSTERRRAVFDGLLHRLTLPERRLLAGLVRGEVRQGAQESLVMSAVAEAAQVPLAELRRAVTVGGSLAEVATAVLRDGPAALERFRLTVGQAVSPMLASSAKSVPEALERTGPAAVEWKLDGIRAQLHKDGERVRVLTRSLDDITDRVPEVVELVRDLPVASAILDGELIALAPDGRPKPFQETASRTASRTDPATGRRQSPLTTFLFDALHLDGLDLLDRPGHERRAALEAALPAEHLTPAATVPDPADAEAVAAAEAFLADALARGHEGVVVKARDSAYEMGRRGAGWVKVKPVHTLDLVVLAVERGNGRRTGWLSNIHLGARDPDGRFGPPGGFVMLGKTFKGMTDAMLRWQTEELPQHAAGPTDGYQVALRPEVVYEVAFDGVQRSPRYPAGLALRFARVVRHRPDKRPEDADTIEAVEALRPG
ncbi:MAG TPA: ATP-dependent DNA ligase [Segeticoccus sp.]|uniref:ATP-dependent DNA ligase n=1 Tax=Segeticoccus sp. TaxID=2706531 RepID=UPI002D7F33B5|nr:ATP-dependent DNA ligase [Segeticoccus sp.]HET8602082.1 ATP-dependent DNA ligase [Segeticoccus sp.]